ncbi:hypothetical protein AB0F91_24265 [Amycolatopsis sp. NPDC023774]|uniref:Gfo/Idh/MocA family protein n=1 Tax=Amycolatopsis sp. NPDC023774 TaxID=3155015 RepID=UPI0033C3F37B
MLPLPRFKDIRYNPSLAGGATMDTGCYAVHVARVLGGAIPAVADARSKLRSPEIDRAMTASSRFPSGATGRVRASLWSSGVLRISARVVCSRGELRAINPHSPRSWHRLSLRRGGPAQWNAFPTGRRTRINWKPSPTRCFAMCRL